MVCSKSMSTITTPRSVVCPTGKRNYTKQGAKRALAHILAQGRDSKPHTGFAPYRCPHCLRWHLGHPGRR